VEASLDAADSYQEQHDTLRINRPVFLAVVCDRIWSMAYRMGMPTSHAGNNFCDASPINTSTFVTALSDSTRMST
jgi:hypothetical protein